MLSLGKSSYFTNVLLNHAFGGLTFNPPVNYYLGLYTSINPTETEVSAPEYVRVQLPNTNLTMPITSNGEKFLTNVDIPFPEAVIDWGTVTHFVLHDAPTGGNVYYTGVFDVPIAINAGTMLNIKAGRLKIVEAGA